MRETPSYFSRSDATTISLRPIYGRTSDFRPSSVFVVTAGLFRACFLNNFLSTGGIRCNPIQAISKPKSY